MDGAAIRSLLFVPGDNERMAVKALASQADAVILDLEDAVAPEAKDSARRIVRGLLDNAERADKAVFVRINALSTSMAVADLAAVLGGRPWGIVVPKCRNRGDLVRISRYLEALEERDGVSAGSVRLLAICTETPAATLAFGQSRRPPPRLWGAMWGGEDLAAEIGSLENRDHGGDYTFPFQYARSQCLLASRAFGAVAVDAVHTSIKDLAELEAETRAGARDGFTAKAAIHPAQVEVINRVFTPTTERLAWAESVRDALRDRAVAKLDGRMIDAPHLRAAEAILRRAAAFGIWQPPTPH